MVVYGWYYRVVLHIMWRAMLRSLHINLRVRFRPQSPDYGHTHDLPMFMTILPAFVFNIVADCSKPSRMVEVHIVPVVTSLVRGVTSLVTNSFMIYHH